MAHLRCRAVLERMAKHGPVTHDGGTNVPQAIKLASAAIPSATCQVTRRRSRRLSHLLMPGSWWYGASPWPSLHRASASNPGRCDGASERQATPQDCRHSGASKARATPRVLEQSRQPSLELLYLSS